MAVYLFFTLGKAKNQSNLNRRIMIYLMVTRSLIPFDVDVIQSYDRYDNFD